MFPLRYFGLTPFQIEWTKSVVHDEESTLLRVERKYRWARAVFFFFASAILIAELAIPDRTPDALVNVACFFTLFWMIEHLAMGLSLPLLLYGYVTTSEEFTLRRADGSFDDEALEKFEDHYTKKRYYRNPGGAWAERVSIALFFAFAVICVAAGYEVFATFICLGLLMEVAVNYFAGLVQVVPARCITPENVATLEEWRLWKDDSEWKFGSTMARRRA